MVITVELWKIMGINLSTKPFYDFFGCMGMSEDKYEEIRAAMGVHQESHDIIHTHMPMYGIHYLTMFG